MTRIREVLPEEEKRIWKTAVYIRLSRDDGNDESLSVSNQRKILLEFLEYSFQGEYTLADIYVDDGQSGTDYDRPGFQKMLRDVESGKVNCIICKNLSRAFRNYSDQGYFLESYFPQHRTRFITLGDPKIDTFLNPEAVSGLEVPINGLMNDRFAYKTSSDIRRTFDTKRRKGEFIGAFAPYGYKKDPEDKNRLLIDPEAAEIVRKIFHWYVYGDEDLKAAGETDGSLYEKRKGSLSKEGIARKLNDLGIPSPAAYKKSRGLKYSNPQTDQSDGLWQGTSISRILNNEMYLGTMVQGKQKVISYKVHSRIGVPEKEWYKVSGTHEPIIEQEVFERARALQQQDIRRAPGQRRNYLFSGFLKCADCQKTMTRKESKGFVYYNCSTYKRKSKTKCTIHTMRLDRLEAAVLTVIRSQIWLVEDLDKILDQIRRKRETEKPRRKLEALRQQRFHELEKTEKFITELYIDWKNKDISREQYREMKEKAQERVRRLKSVIQNIQEDLKAAEPEEGFYHPYLQSFLEKKNIPFLSQGILNELVGKILVHENGGITIVFRFTDPYVNFRHKQNPPDG